MPQLPLGRRVGLGFVLGTRRSDPNASGQGNFAPTSDGYPAFWRVNPLWDWQTSDVWSFLEKHGLPYCPLYDRGYTSVGGVLDTAPNPSLRRNDGTYAPAKDLADDGLERAGRGKRGSIRAQTVTVPFAAKSCGLVVIGDEILKGQTPDLNIKETATRLRSQGLYLLRSAIVPDDLTEISREVRQQSAAFDFVITSGGVGPTHDDVTIRSVAMALGVGTCTAADSLKSLLPDWHEADLPLLPLGHALRWIEGEEWPILQVGNVFVLPGVPHQFVRVLGLILDNFVQGPGRRAVRRLRLSAAEPAIASCLSEVAAAAPVVNFGSYPAASGTTILVEARTDEEVESAVAKLLSRLPTSAVFSVDAEDALP